MKRSVVVSLAVLLFLIFLAALYSFNGTFHSRINGVVFLFTSKDIRTVAGYIRSYGPFSILVSILLMIFQSFIPPFSCQLVVMANASVYGRLGGAVVSWAGAVAGACAVFLVVRAIIRPLLAILVRRFRMERPYSFLQRNGGAATLFFRLLPFFPSDVVSMLGGLLPVKFAHFCLATALAELPYVIAWSYIGKSLSSRQEQLLMGVTVLLAVCVLLVAWRYEYRCRQNMFHDRSQSWKKGKN